MFIQGTQIVEATRKHPNDQHGLSIIHINANYFKLITIKVYRVCHTIVNVLHKMK